MTDWAASTSMAHDRAYLPATPDGFEPYTIRRWRDRLNDRLTAEGVRV